MKTAATIALRSVPRAALAIPPAWRRRLAATLAALIVLGSLYWFWFRDSSFAQVKDVDVTGVDGPQARAIRAQLVDAGLDQTTLHVSQAELRAAVANFPVVRSVTAQGDFPHTLRIDVSLNLPVAVLQTPAGRKPVAADGLLLPDVPVSGNLPVLKTQATISTERLTSGAAFDLVRVVAVAPEPLRARIASVGVKAGSGIVVKLTKGPDLIFGNAERIPAKWMAAARVLAAAGARGASYIDLRLPERPAAGGLAITTVVPLAPAGEAAPAPTTTTPATTGQTPTGTTTAPSPATTGQTPATATTPAPTQTATTTPQSTVPATSGGAAQAPTNAQPQVESTPQP
jgi:cell division protein FtsQ